MLDIFLLVPLLIITGPLAWALIVALLEASIYQDAEIICELSIGSNPNSLPEDQTSSNVTRFVQSCSRIAA